MANPTTILEYAAQRRDNIQTDVTKAQQQLADTQAAVAEKSKELANATSELSALQQQADQIREKLSLPQTAADRHALVDALEEITIRIRTGEADVISGRGPLATAQRDAGRAQTQLANVTMRLTGAEADLAEADRLAQERAARAVVLGAPPYSTLKTDATNALDETTLPEGKNYRDAKARLTVDTADHKRDIPAKLYVRARDRRENAKKPGQQAQLDVQAAIDAVLKEQNDGGGTAGAAQKLWALFQQAETKVEEFVTTAPTRFDKAKANLARVANLQNAPLTAEQFARINDSGLAASRGTAVDDEKARDDKGKAIGVALAALDAEILKALAAGKNPDDVAAVQNKRTALQTAIDNYTLLDGPWRADEKDRNAKLEIVATREKELQEKIDAAVAAQTDPETDPAVIQAKADLNTAKTNLSVAETKYKTSGHFILHAWEAAVPDSMWRLVEDFAEAEDILTELGAIVAGTLESDRVAAELAYVTAQVAADASQSKIGNLSGEQARREARLDTEGSLASNRTFGALRGDN